MNKCVVLIGPPCSGKSTIGKTLSYDTGFRYISSGDIARKMAEEDGSMDNLNAGNMAPEDRMREEISKIFNDDGNIIIDGFPRFEAQYEWMVSRFFKYEFTFVFIDVPTLSLFHRAASRRRIDDKAFDERLKYYHDHTAPMINRINKDMAMHGGVVYVTNNDAIHKSVREIEDYLYDRGWI